MGRRRDAALLALFLAGGAGFRAWGLFHGLADDLVYHPDAYFVVNDAWQHALGAPWSAGHFGATYAMLVRAAMRVVDGARGYLGLPETWSFGMIGAAASAASAVLGTLTILAAYLLGARAYGRPAGLVGAALLTVCPLHVFQSHYPYRDVPMTLALVLALAGAVSWARSARLPWLALAVVFGAVAASLKTTGFLVLLPLLVAVALTWTAVPRWVAGVAGVAVAAAVLAGVWLHGIPTLPGKTPIVLDDPWTVVRSLVEFVGAYLSAFGGELLRGLPAAGALLWHWAGPAAALLALAGVAWAAACHRRADLVLLASVVPAFVAAAMFRWLDERYLVALMPVTAVLAGRLAVDAWKATPRRRLVQLGVLVVLGWTLASGTVESAWRGRLLTLPDTRAVAGRWLKAHVPPPTPVVAEPYGPLGLESRPGVVMLDPTRPVAEIGRVAPLLVTSSLTHQRYLDDPASHPRAAAFFRQAESATRPVRTITLAPLGFVHPTIEFRATGLPADAPGLPVDVPRAYDPAWSQGLAFVPSGPYDRDDRTIALGRSQLHALTLVSPARLPELTAFVANGAQPSEIRLRAAGRRARQQLAPGEMAVLRLVPGRTWGRPPVLTPVELTIRPYGASALVQLRVGTRETGLAALAWGRPAEAVSALRGSIQADPGDLLARLGLIRALGASGQPEEARREAAELGPADARAVAAYRRLAEADEAGWEQRFAEATGLAPGLLRQALTVSLEAEEMQASGRVLGDQTASRGLVVTAAPGPGAAGEAVLVNGPDLLFLPPGAFRAVFTLRAIGGPAAPGRRAVLRVFAEATLLAERALSASELGPGPGFTDVAVPFVHRRPGDRVAVQVGIAGPLEVDRVRVEPDLREAVRAVVRGLGSAE